MKCQECGHELQSADEYHPLAFCILWKAGINPVEFVYEVVHEMGLLNASGPPIPQSELPLCDCGMGDGSMPELHADDCAINAA